MESGVDHRAFMDSLEAEAPPKDWPDALRALWYDARGDWDASHDIAQDLPTPVGSWIHGYLHLKEGDRWNAAYWYRQAGRAFPEGTVDEEFRVLLQSLTTP